jgi:hypothetical protein
MISHPLLASPHYLCSPPLLVLRRWHWICTATPDPLAQSPRCSRVVSTLRASMPGIRTCSAKMPCDKAAIVVFSRRTACSSPHRVTYIASTRRRPLASPKSTSNTAMPALSPHPASGQSCRWVGRYFSQPASSQLVLGHVPFCSSLVHMCAYLLAPDTGSSPGATATARVPSART